MKQDAPTATIEIRRSPGLVDGLRYWRIILDGQDRGRIWRKRMRTFQVNPGEHTVRMRISVRGSNVVTLNVATGARVVLVCRPTHDISFGRGQDVLVSMIEMMRDRANRITLERTE